jgi:hypothetical protein
LEIPEEALLVERPNRIVFPAQKVVDFVAKSDLPDVKIDIQGL